MEALKRLLPRVAVWRGCLAVNRRNRSSLAVILAVGWLCLGAATNPRVHLAGPFVASTTVRCWGSPLGSPDSEPTDVLLKVGVGATHACGIRFDNSVVCWGYTLYGAENPPAGSFKEIASGQWHTCGIKTDGGVACWGQITNVPTQGAYSKITSAYQFSCAIAEDGGLHCWGVSSYGATVPPAGKFTDVDARSEFACGVRTDGSVVCWGRNVGGVLSIPVPPGPFAQVAVGTGHVCALRSSGQVVCWGAMNSPEDAAFVQISSGGTHACGILTDGSLQCWGGNYYGESDPPVGKFSALDSGAYVNCALTLCGDGVLDEGEDCDDGNVLDGDGCDSNCIAEMCGNGKVQAGEECDDGNTADGDGCSRRCEIQRLCGDATDDGKILASDALRTLQRAVGQDVDCPDWICDINDDARVTAGDALGLLKASVGLPVALHCGDPTALVLRLVTPTVLGSLQVDVDYTGVAGDLPGEGAGVHCEGLIPGASYAFNDKPAKVLSMCVLALDGFSGPRSVARCEFTPTANVEPEDFVVTVLDATSPSGQPVAGVQVRALPY